MGSAAASLAAPRSPRYASLDLWRGVACLLVVLHHATLYAPAYRQAESGAAVAANPASWFVAATTRFWIGVPLFFVISGYCISATADSTRRRPRALVTYFTRRFRRIYPPYWVLLVLLAIFVIALEWIEPKWLADDYAGISPPTLFSPGQLVGNLTLTESWRHHLGGSPLRYFNAMAWTLCYEEQFYAVVGLLLVLAPRRFFLGAAVVTVLTAALGAIVTRRAPIDGFFFDGYWLHFAAGILLYYSVNYARGWQTWAANLLLLAGLVYFARRGFPWSHAHSTVAAGGVVACAFALLLSGLQRWDRQLASARLARPLLFCGHICYSLYLVHWPICKAVGHGLYLLGVRGDTATVLVTVPAAVAASIFLAWVFFRLCERRFLNGPVRAAPREPAPRSPPSLRRSRRITASARSDQPIEIVSGDVLAGEDHARWVWQLVAMRPDERDRDGTGGLHQQGLAGVEIGHCRLDGRIAYQADGDPGLRDSLLHRGMRHLQDQAVGDSWGAGMVVGRIGRCVVRLASDQGQVARMSPQIRGQAHEQAAAADRKNQRAAAGQAVQDLFQQRLVAVGPERVEMRVDEIAVTFLGDLGGALQKGGAAAADLDQFHAERLQFFVLGPADGFRHHADHAEAELAGGDGGAQGRVPHRRHHQ